MTRATFAAIERGWTTCWVCELTVETSGEACDVAWFRAYQTRWTDTHWARERIDAQIAVQRARLLNKERIAGAAETTWKRWNNDRSWVFLIILIIIIISYANSLRKLCASVDGKRLRQPIVIRNRSFMLVITAVDAFFRWLIKFWTKRVYQWWLSELDWGHSRNFISDQTC